MLELGGGQKKVVCREIDYMKDDAFSQFIEKYPAFKDTTALDLLRKKDYQILDAEGHIYLDYTGGGLYAGSQLDAHQELLRKNIFGFKTSF